MEPFNLGRPRYFLNDVEVSEEVVRIELDVRWQPERVLIHGRPLLDGEVLRMENKFTLAWPEEGTEVLDGAS